jgi:hypothetical protein
MDMGEYFLDKGGKIPSLLDKGDHYLDKGEQIQLHS